MVALAPSLPSPSGTSVRSSRHVPLLSLAPPALALGDELAVGEPGEENSVGEIWNGESSSCCPKQKRAEPIPVITRAADLVKDGERLENLAWRSVIDFHHLTVDANDRDAFSGIGANPAMRRLVAGYPPHPMDLPQTHLYRHPMSLLILPASSAGHSVALYSYWLKRAKEASRTGWKTLKGLCHKPGCLPSRYQKHQLPTV